MQMTIWYVNATLNLDFTIEIHSVEYLLPFKYCSTGYYFIYSALFNLARRFAQDRTDVRNQFSSLSRWLQQFNYNHY